MDSGFSSHEAGHALGLSHDGTKSGVEYYTGHGTGEISWSPIMGWTNYGLSQWSRGEYSGANNKQNDLKIITENNGFGFRPDDHGSTIETATAIDVETSTGVTGIISESLDVDFFAVTLPRSGTLQLALQPDNLAPNLDIEAQLLTADGSVLETSNPPTELTAGFDVALQAGEYFLSVDGVGYDDPNSDGYTDYASLGFYRIDLSFEADFEDSGDPSDSGQPNDSAQDSGGGQDSAGSGDSGQKQDTANEDGPKEDPAGGCSCSTQRSPWSASLLLLAAGVVFLRRRW